MGRWDEWTYTYWRYLSGEASDMWPLKMDVRRLRGLDVKAVAGSCSFDVAETWQFSATWHQLLTLLCEDPILYEESSLG